MAHTKTNKVSEYKKLHDEAIRISILAIKLLKSLQSDIKLHKQKDDRDFLTNADILAEELICREIFKLDPRFNILSEEMGEINKGNNYSWIIDPLDGTQAFAAQLNDYGVLIAVEHKMRLVAASISLAEGTQIYSTYLQGNSFSNARKIHVSVIKSLKNAFIWEHAPRAGKDKALINSSLRCFEKLTKSAYKVVSQSSDIIALCYVARGYFDGYIGFPQSIGGWWDVAPGILLVEEAGGKVTDFSGNRIKNRDLSNGLVASNGLIHAELLDLIKV